MLDFSIKENLYILQYSPNPITASLVVVSVGILIVVSSILGAISDVKSFGFVVDFVVDVDERVQISKSESSKMSGFAVVSKSLLSKSTSGLCVVVILGRISLESEIISSWNGTIVVSSKSSIFGATVVVITDNSLIIAAVVVSFLISLSGIVV